MGFLDKLKLDKKSIDKAKDLVGDNADKVKTAVDKAADVVDKQTKGKYSAKIDDAADKAKGAVDKLDDDPKKG